MKKRKLTLSPPSSIPAGRNLYLAIGDKCRLSERTIRNAFANKPVTWQTAAKIAKALGVDMREIRVKVDNRGKKNGADK